MNSRPRQLILILLLAALPLWTCSGNMGTAHLTIELGLPHHATFQAAPTAFERICALFPLFPKLAHAAPPANITGLKLKVAQGGAITFEDSFSPGSSSISADVPAGSGLTVTVTAFIDPADIGAVLEYAGSANANLSPGDEVTISIRMMASETKIVIPDYGYSTIIQVDDITGNNKLSLPVGGCYSPNDVAFDAAGRIYIAFSSGGLVRVDDILGSNQISSYDITSMGSIRAVAVDRAAGFVYYANAGNMIRRTTLTPGTYATYAPSNLNQISGLAVADDGTLYISGVYNSDDAVVHFDPEANSGAGEVIDTPYTGGMITRRAIHVKFNDPYVYVINTSYISTPVGEILKFSKNLQFIEKTGAVTSSMGSIESAPMEFFHPVHFVAVLNRKFTIMDTDTSSSYDRIVSFGNLEGSDWSAYAEYQYSGSSTMGTYFSFYSFS
ncbi:MAG: hypothetical protein EPN93_04630 [Spirochaetes bacterium]|nr:MAG: hypothetical protein EPN93_04630 [Spirochaetota bacterium]